MQRSAKAVWNGDLKTGAGSITTGSGALKDRKYNFVSRFEDGNETNPEELVAAAHAGCFSMALNAELGRAGVAVTSVTTESKVTLDRVDGKPTVTKIDLHTHVVAPGGDREKIQAAAEGTKVGCVISRLLNAPMTLTTQIDV
jgi:osmotically inducible protein OsmC